MAHLDQLGRVDAAVALRCRLLDPELVDAEAADPDVCDRPIADDGSWGASDESCAKGAERVRQPVQSEVDGRRRWVKR